MKSLESLRDWAISYTSQGRFSPAGVWFHWIMAALILFQLGLGWMMERVEVGADKLSSYALHSEVGMLILLLAILRAVWRLFIPDPINAADDPGWKSRAALFVEYAFYFFFALLPLSGWAMWSAIQPSQPLSLGGMIPLPPMPFYDLSPAMQIAILDLAEDIHVAGVTALALLIPLHVGAALKHHFWNQDDVVEGILPQIQDDPSHPQYAKYSRQDR